MLVSIIRIRIVRSITYTNNAALGIEWPTKKLITYTTRYHYVRSDLPKSRSSTQQDIIMYWVTYQKVDHLHNKISLCIEWPTKKSITYTTRYHYVLSDLPKSRSPTQQDTIMYWVTYQKSQSPTQQDTITYWVTYLKVDHLHKQDTIMYWVTYQKVDHLHNKIPLCTEWPTKKSIAYATRYHYVLNDLPKSQSPTQTRCHYVLSDLPKSRSPTQTRRHYVLSDLPKSRSPTQQDTIMYWVTYQKVDHLHNKIPLCTEWPTKKSITYTTRHHYVLSDLSKVDHLHKQDAIMYWVTYQKVDHLHNKIALCTEWPTKKSITYTTKYHYVLSDLPKVDHLHKTPLCTEWPTKKLIT